MGAGVIPLAIKNGELLFLFQKTFSGREIGYLIDFGGGLGDGEDFRATAMREFVEEAETMYLTYDLKAAQRSEGRVMKQAVKKIKPDKLKPMLWQLAAMLKNE